MAHLFIMCGLAFSGKSTLSCKIAEYIGGKRIAFDDVWVKKDKENPIPKNDEGWKFIRKVCFDEITKTLNKETSVIYDDNNPKLEHREELRKLAKKLGFKETIIYVNTPMEIIRLREAANKTTGERHTVEPINFQKVANDLEAPTSKEDFLEFTPATNLNEFLHELDSV